MYLRVEQQCHGYKNGHQMLAGSLRLSRSDQDAVDRMSDISGPLRPGETFAAYLSAYPLPSKRYYVIARTWQDLKAPRAGCVLTRSLLIEMPSWSALDFPSSLVDLLDPIDEANPTARSIDFTTHSVSMAAVKTKRTVSLVEALFLESRNPIVMFDEPESELISLRLLSALWPAFRQTFSLCTLSFSPRSMNGKSFDLMFAPREAKSRFAQWQGRVFDSPSIFSKADVPRHRWSTITTEHIFIDDPPSLVSLDALGVLGASEGADESSLRLALLWNELLEKAETSPTAILGLLDILRSRGKFSSEAVMPFLPVLLRGIELAKVTLGTSDVLRFVLTLVGKFPSERPPIDVLNKIREVLSFCASHNPQAVVGLYRDTSLSKELRSPLVTAGLGDGLARSLSGLHLLAMASTFMPEDQLRLISFSKQWTQSIISLTAETSPAEWSSWLTRALEYPDSELKARARRRILPYLSSSQQAPLLRAMLEDVDGRTVLSTAEQIRESSDFQFAGFDGPLSDAAKRAEVTLELREEILKAGNEVWSDRFMAATMSFDRKDIEWLLQNRAYTNRRLVTLALQLFRNASDESVRKLMDAEKLLSRLEKLFIEELPSASTEVAKLLLLNKFPTSTLLNDGMRVLADLDAPTRNNLSRLMLERGFTNGSERDDETLEVLLSQSSAFSDARAVVFMALSQAVDKDRVAKNLVILNRAGAKVRHGILNEIEVVTDQLIYRPFVDFTVEALRSWVSLLTDAGTVNPYGQGRSAAKILAFALEHRSKPYSALVTASFPLVYEQLRSGQESPGPLSFLFTDWDRCKTARKDITQAFIHSDWPAVDLLRAVAPTGDLDKVFRTLSRDREGERYLSKLEEGLSKLGKGERRKMEEMVGKVLEPRASDHFSDFE
jgi:hypothetical protein